MPFKSRYISNQEILDESITYEKAMMKLAPYVGNKAYGSKFDYFDLCFVLHILFDKPNKMDIGIDFAHVRDEYLELKKVLG